MLLDNLAGHLQWVGLARAHVAGVESNNEDYMTSFFDQWDFKPGDDPTHGTVDYVTREVAEEADLVRAHPDGVYIGVDNKMLAPSCDSLFFPNDKFFS